MLYLFTGNSEYLIHKNIGIWKTRFIEKHGDFNLIHISNLLDHDTNFLSENLLAGSFLAEKKLIIIDIDSTEKKEKYTQNLEFLLGILERIPEDNIVIFNIVHPDKRTKFFKQLSKQAEKKEFNIDNEADTNKIIELKYGDRITLGAINTITRYKGNHIEKIINELEKLSINHEKITEELIKEHILPELEESIFQIIDDILNGKKTAAIRKIDSLLEQTNVYAFYNNLIANLRTSVYISTLKAANLRSSEINNILKLGNRAFLIDRKHSVSYKELKTLYIKLIEVDAKMKSGHLLGSDDSDLQLEIDKVIISY